MVHCFWSFVFEILSHRHGLLLDSRHTLQPLWLQFRLQQKALHIIRRCRLRCQNAVALHRAWKQTRRWRRMRWPGWSSRRNPSFNGASWMFITSSQLCQGVECMLMSFVSRRLTGQLWCYLKRTISWLLSTSNSAQRWRFVHESIQWRNDSWIMNSYLLIADIVNCTSLFIGVTGVIPSWLNRACTPNHRYPAENFLLFNSWVNSVQIRHYIISYLIGPGNSHLQHRNFTQESFDRLTTNLRHALFCTLNKHRLVGSESSPQL